MGRRYLPWLWALATLYVLRVAAQIVQTVRPVGWLPPADAWNGGGLPYSLQLLMHCENLLGLALVLWAVRRDAVQPARWAQRACVGIGAAYFGAMALRIGLGQTVLADSRWFAAALPAAFHLVLASFLIVFGLYLRARAAQPWVPNGRWQRVLERWSYPVVMGVTLAYFPGLVDFGLPIGVAAYVAAGISAGLVLFHERVHPYRREWRNTLANVPTDATYFALMQVGLPTLLSVTLVVWLSEALQRSGLVVDGLWPHHWPFAAQAILIVVAADFFRYWLHRAMHRVPLLWRLHAVHHAPQRLYALNVGWVHPIEKAVQFCADALPFALLGVAPEVLAARILIYSANGFYQHCNCQLRMGWLNYVIAGPELHRWHHSMLPGEADNNYGNNVIVWDLLFGTWFLPKERSVGDLGLMNRSYPTGFLGHLKAPFVRGLEGSEGRTQNTAASPSARA